MNFKESSFLKFSTGQVTGKEQKIVMWVRRLGRKYSPLLNPELLWKKLHSVTLTLECIVEISFCVPSQVTTSVVFSYCPDCFVCSGSFWSLREMLRWNAMVRPSKQNLFLNSTFAWSNWFLLFVKTTFWNF